MKTLTGPLASLSISVLLLTGCGGGGGDDDDDGGGGGTPTPTPVGWSTPPAPSALPPTGATVDGIFRDAVVEGLDYSDGAALVGITDSGGRFRYAQGNTVTFRIGGLTLGNLVGQPVMTPMHLVGTGNTNLTFAINNRLRLLQALDRDNNPDNGILISNAVRAVAANWSTPNFDVAYSTFASSVQPLIQAANAADGVTHTMPSETTASGHFVRTAWCTHNGLYRGVYSGSDSGFWAMVTYGVGGQIFGGAYSTVDRDGTIIQTDGQSGLSIFPRVSVSSMSGGTTFSVRFDSPTIVTGTWTDTPTGSGSLIGARSGGSSTAVYRISGYQFPVGTALLIALEVDGTNAVTGQIFDNDFARTGVPVDLSGTLSGTTLTAAGPGYTINGTFNTANAAALTLTGTLVDTAKSRNVNLTLPACKLN